MIMVSASALEVISHTYEAEPNLNRKPVRIAVVGGGCSGVTYTLDFDEPDEDDFSIDFPYRNEDITFIIDPYSLPYIKGTFINWVSGLTQSGFVFDNPNAKRHCGCGKSFGV